MMTIGSLLTLFGAGLLTFASPCVLPMLPVYLSALGGAGALGGPDPAAAKRGVRLAGVGFAIGLAIVLVALGAGASAIAAVLAPHRRAFTVASGVILALFGAKLLGVLRLPWLEREARPLLSRLPSAGGFWGGTLFGIAFAAGWTPCVGPVLGAALTYSASAGASPLTGAIQLGAYAAGLAAPLVAAAFVGPAAVELARRVMPATPALQRLTGALLVAAGIAVAAGRLDALSPAPAAALDAGAPCEVGPAGACAAPEGAVAHGDVALPEGMPRLLEFESAHCAVCERMAPLMKELEARCAREDGTVLRIQVDDPRGRALAARYGVRFVPTFLSVDAAGQEVERAVGELPAQRLASLIGDVRGEACPPAL
ncbi:cytochrome c biogenesis protein/redoxin [Sorangium atrum]|uniref:Cytochrome c biogenesis protein/redoxin n=1 Tax=Sorangium atrum TaxID=2995308 RepID=A0ABT5BYN5_9BACT|nr:cytochrome c biogenesis protein/redoxin [Sorangium aterium]MDC0679264.1 cytochrome c biogenesis protein/redoxin [Sorangium aterium]